VLLVGVHAQASYGKRWLRPNTLSQTSMPGGIGGVLALMGEWPATGKGPVIEVQRDWSRPCDQAALTLGARLRSVGQADLDWRRRRSIGAPTWATSSVRAKPVSQSPAAMHDFAKGRTDFCAGLRGLWAIVLMPAGGLTWIGRAVGVLSRWLVDKHG